MSASSMRPTASPALSSHSASSLSSLSSSASSASSSSSASSASSSSPPSRHSTVETYKCAVPLQNPRTHDVFQSIVKGRKSWKTLRGGEVVWPPELEAALIEGLENYQPDDSRETRLLGRFPMRNRFISDWIFEKTGKRRTAKQVGSRLQQLRDTCGGKRLLNLLSPIRRPHPHTHPRALSPDFPSSSYPSSSSSTYPHSYPSSSSDSSASQPATPTEAHATLQSLLYRGVETRAADASCSSAYSYSVQETVVFIDLVAEDGAASSSSSQQQQVNNTAAEERAYQERGYAVTRASPCARRLCEIDPTITFLSRSPSISSSSISSTSNAHARSHFAVHRDDAGVVFEESTPLEALDQTLDVNANSQGNGECARLYRTKLVPGYWDVIVRSGDASRYTIVQRVVQDPSASNSNSSNPSSPSGSSSNPSSSNSSTTIFSAVYRFVYSPSSSPPSSSSSLHTQHSMHAYATSTSTAMHMEPQIHRQHQQEDFGFDAATAGLLSMDTNVDFSDVDMNMMGFPASKTNTHPNANANNFFAADGNNNPYMRSEWDGTPSPASVQSLPMSVSVSMPSMYTGNGVHGMHAHGNGQFLAPPFSMDSVSAYAL